jgi:hypothetical protein
MDFETALAQGEGELIHRLFRPAVPRSEFFRKQSYLHVRIL